MTLILLIISLIFFGTDHPVLGGLFLVVTAVRISRS